LYTVSLELWQKVVVMLEAYIGIGYFIASYAPMERSFSTAVEYVSLQREIDLELGN